MRLARSFSLATLLCTLLLSLPLQGEEAADGVEGASGPKEVIRYVELKPSFVTNFGVSDTGHLRYIKADVTVLVHNKDAEYAARYHAAALRDRMVLLLSRQDESTIATSAGRETIRAEAIAEFREVLEREEGDGFIEDLMFTNFIVQR